MHWQAGEPELAAGQAARSTRMVSINSNNKSNFVAASASTGSAWTSASQGVCLAPRWRWGLGLYTDGKAKLPPANAPNISDEERGPPHLSLLSPRSSSASARASPSRSWPRRHRVSATCGSRWSCPTPTKSNGQIFHQGKNQGLDDAVGLGLVYAF
ncbi:hypothetical protein ACRAWD_01555 [Caulobacter segnis]